MYHSRRQCAGVKACEFLADELKAPHTAIENDGHKWAQLLALQERAEAMTYTAQVETTYEQHKDDVCDRPNLSGRGVCNGSTVIRSLKPKTCIIPF